MEIKKKKKFLANLNTNTSKRKNEKKKKTIPGGGCRTTVEAQAVVETLVAIRQGYLSW